MMLFSLGVLLNEVQGVLLEVSLKLRRFCFTAHSEEYLEKTPQNVWQGRGLRQTELCGKLRKLKAHIFIQEFSFSNRACK